MSNNRMTPMTPTQPIHAHSVLDLFALRTEGIESHQAIPQIEDAFGTDARFFACSASDMTAAELMEFLLRREKLVEADGRLHLNRANICSH